MISSLATQIPFSEAAEGKTIRKIIKHTSGDTFILIAYMDGSFSCSKTAMDFDGTIIDDFYHPEYLIHQFDDEQLLEVFSKKIVASLHKEYEKELSERLDSAEKAEYKNYLRLKNKFEGNE